jgi:hypothetical protein
VRSVCRRALTACRLRRSAPIAPRRAGHRRGVPRLDGECLTRRAKAPWRECIRVASGSVFRSANPLLPAWRLLSDGRATPSVLARAKVLLGQEAFDSWPPDLPLWRLSTNTCGTNTVKLPEYSGKRVSTLPIYRSNSRQLYAACGLCGFELQDCVPGQHSVI